MAYLLHSFTLRLHPWGMHWRIWSNEVANVLLVTGLKHKCLLCQAWLCSAVQFQSHVVIIWIYEDRFYFTVSEVMDDWFVLSSDKLNSIHVDSQEGLTGMWPHSFVHNGEHGAAIEGELLNTGQVPDFGFQFTLVTSIVLGIKLNQPNTSNHKVQTYKEMMGTPSVCLLSAETQNNWKRPDKGRKRMKIRNLENWKITSPS